ncbi:MAG: B12-binding domain-containing radical SAM protein [Spirochaetes bacterium]|nr:B12-binding domain-containing radical SAM protein [Spirochaetota bacterium]
MRILLLAMPDTVSALDAVTTMPNLGLASIAGSVAGHDVSIADLAFFRRNLTAKITSIIRRVRPDVIGLSAMSFQYASACRVARIVRTAAPGTPVVLGGYHATLMYEEIASGNDRDIFDFLIRGEGETSFAALIRAIGSGQRYTNIPGLSYRSNGVFHHNRPSMLMDLVKLPLPDRGARILDRSRFLGMRFDCVETSRGCTMGCRFCSITEMYGRRIRYFPIPRIIEELTQLKRRGVGGVFFVDDNITLDVRRLGTLCEAIIDARLDTLMYVTQASVRGICADSSLPQLLARAGFRWVFLGIENQSARNLSSLGKAHEPGDAVRAVSVLRRNGIGVFGGFIVGNPDDTRDDIAAAFRDALESGVDHPIMQCLTPYPKTGTRDDLTRAGLITNGDDFSRYNGFIANVRTKSLSNSELAKAILVEGVKLYFNPKLIIRSRFWRFHPSLWLPLLANNIRFIIGALGGKLFASRHSW